MANADNAESNGNGSASVSLGASNGINNATNPVSSDAYATTDNSNTDSESGSGDAVSASSLPQTGNSTDSQSIKTVGTILLAESFASLGLTLKRRKNNY